MCDMFWGERNRWRSRAVAGLVLSAAVAGCVGERPTLADADTTTTQPTTTAAPAPESGPTTTVPAPPAPPTPSADFPGAVPAGNVRFGAAIHGNGDPARHEDPTGEPLALHRTFWQWDERATNMVDTASDDIANNRLPWVSIKPGGSWDEMGSGAFDAQIDEMLHALDAIGGPVWLTVHHEPEGGAGSNEPDDPGGAPAWREMQQRVGQRIDAVATQNIAFAPILMSWTWDSRSGRDPDEWWVDGVWDFFGIDHYQEEQASPMTETWDKVRRWLGDHGLPVAVGEWGMRGEDAAAGQRVQNWYEHAIGSARDGKGAQVIGLSAFDSNLNAPTGGWVLKGEQLRVFQQLLGDPRTLDASEP